MKYSTGFILFPGSPISVKIALYTCQISFNLILSIFHQRA